ncbi:MAG TPA: hypothetical protein VFI13_11250, partial [Gemmatimonadales bacterium]|nr:hypothetical protein [Gemmatimonadales bacterium]
MLFVLWALQAGVPPSYPPIPRLHLTAPAEWVDAGHVAPFAPAIVLAARRELVTVPPPEPPAARPSDVRLWRPDGVEFAVVGMTRALATRSTVSRRPREVVPPIARVWPDLPPPRADALLPSHRIIAFYGNPKSTRMGILGELPPAQMLDRLQQVADEWTAADPSTPALPALHLIVTVAHGRPGEDGLYRIRHGADVIEQVLGWAQSRGWLVFLDIQPGQSTVQAEVQRLLPYLARPNVHLALDPEFAMKDGRLPGKYIGTMDAAEVNFAVGVLERMVDSLHLPPKVIVVHRFTHDMLTNARSIRVDPRGR